MENPVKDIRAILASLISGSPEEQSSTLSKFFVPNASFTHPFCRVPAFSHQSLNSRTLILQILKWYRFLSPTTDLTIHSAVFDKKQNILYVKTSQIFSIWFIPFHRTPPVNLVTVLQLEPTSSSSPYSDEPSHDDEEGDGSETVYDAAQETRQLIQEGEKPSYTDVVENGPAAHPAPSNGDAKGRKQHEKQEQQQQQRSSRDGQRGGTTKYYIRSQDDLYQVNDFLKFLTLGFGSWVYMIWQLFATLLCVALIGVLGPVMKMVAPKALEGKGVRVHY